MKTIAFDHVEPIPDFSSLPIEVRLSTSRMGSALRLLLLAPMMIGLAVPLSMIGARAAGESSALTIIAMNPAATLQAGIGLIVWTMLFRWPLKRIIARMGASRVVEISAAQVTVVDSSPFSERTWSAPLETYRGIAHHIRASLSGNRHELFLVHSDPRKTVLITAADRITHTTLERAKVLLGLPEVPARTLYDRGRAA